MPARWGSQFFEDSAEAVNQTVSALCVAEAFTAWKLYSDRKYPKEMKVAIAVI